MTLQDWFTGRLVELGDDECWELLRQHAVGRLAWCGPSGPRLVPVNFVEDSQRLWIRTAPYSQLARECQDAAVVFEVDDIDEFTRSGVSVVARGSAHYQDLVELRRADVTLDPWPEGQRSLVVRVTVHEIAGRRLLPS